jgi:hypothetical protein
MRLNLLHIGLTGLSSLMRVTDETGGHTAACPLHAVSSDLYSAAGCRIGGLPGQVVYSEKEALHMSAVMGDGLKPRKVR